MGAAGPCAMGRCGRVLTFTHLMTPSQRIVAAIDLFNNKHYGQALAQVTELIEGDAANVNALNLAAACGRMCELARLSSNN